MERWWYVGATVRVGWGGMGGLKNVQLYFHTHVMLRYCRFFLLPHTRHATLLQVPLALAHTHTRHATLLQVLLALPHTHVILRYCRFLLHLHTHTHAHVMLRYCRFFLHLRTHVMLRYYCRFLLHLHTHTHVMLRYCRFFLHLHTHVMLRYCRFLLHLHAHTHTHVMLRYCRFFLHLHTHVMLRYCRFLLHLHTVVTQRWGGVGWGGGANNVQVYFHTHVMLRYCTFLACGNTYASSSTDITRRTRPPRCSGWKTSFASFCSSGPWMMIQTKHCKYQVKCSILIDFSRVLRLTEEAC